MAGHHRHVGAPVLQADEHSHPDFVHTGLTHTVEAVDAPFKVAFHPGRVIYFVALSVVGFLEADYAVET